MEKKNKKQEDKNVTKTSNSNYKKAFFYKDLKDIIEDESDPLIDFDTGEIKTYATISMIRIK